MISDAPTHSELIDEIGAEIVRRQFNLSHQRLYAWRKRGIPYSHRAAFAQLATLHGKQLPSDFLAPPEEPQSPKVPLVTSGPCVADEPREAA